MFNWRDNRDERRVEAARIYWRKFDACDHKDCGTLARNPCREIPHYIGIVSPGKGMKHKLMEKAHEGRKLLPREPYRPGRVSAS